MKAMRVDHRKEPVFKIELSLMFSDDCTDVYLLMGPKGGISKVVHEARGNKMIWCEKAGVCQGHDDCKHVRAVLDYIEQERERGGRTREIRRHSQQSA